MLGEQLALIFADRIGSVSFCCAFRYPAADPQPQQVVRGAQLSDEQAGHVQPEVFRVSLDEDFCTIGPVFFAKRSIPSPLAPQLIKKKKRRRRSQQRVINLA